MKQTKLSYKRGDCILREKPFAYCLSAKYRTERCDFCFKLSNVRKCSNCLYVHYCDRACQMEAWSQHKLECPGLKQLYENSRNPPDTARMLSHIILKLKNGGETVKGFYSEHSYRKFRDLMTHYANIKNDEGRMEHFEVLTIILQKILPNITLPNSTELLQIYGKLLINSFNILDNEMNSIGTGLYLGASVVDHSCKPNAVAIFYGTEINIRLLEDVNDFDWSKINISYIELMNTPTERRKELKDGYYFHCTCTRCIDPGETIAMLKAVCVKCHQQLDITTDTDNVKCMECSTIMSTDFTSTYNEVIQLTKSKLQEMKHIAYLDVCTLLLNKQENILHKNNVYHLKTLDSAFEGALEIGKYEEAVEYGIRLTEGFKKYYGDYNPLIGLLYMKIGKMLLYLDNVREANKYLTDSLAVIRVTHGENHPLYTEHLVQLLMESKLNS